eukprot:SAG11_NODE_1607_length_4590_cov_2.099978_3_plen_358_part_00
MPSHRVDIRNLQVGRLFFAASAARHGGSQSPPTLPYPTLPSNPRPLLSTSPPSPSHPFPPLHLPPLHLPPLPSSKLPYSEHAASMRTPLLLQRRTPRRHTKLRRWTRAIRTTLIGTMVRPRSVMPFLSCARALPLLCDRFLIGIRGPYGQHSVRSRASCATSMVSRLRTTTRCGMPSPPVEARTPCWAQMQLVDSRRVINAVRGVVRSSTPTPTTRASSASMWRSGSASTSSMTTGEAKARQARAGVGGGGGAGAALRCAMLFNSVRRISITNGVNVPNWLSGTFADRHEEVTEVRAACAATSCGFHAPCQPSSIRDYGHVTAALELRPSNMRRSSATGRWGISRSGQTNSHRATSA